MHSHSHTTRGAEAGFTILEVLIALTIFTIAVTGVITAAVQGGINVTAAQTRMTASYLADEGIELMRAKRDSYVLANGSGYNAGWAAFVGDTLTGCQSSGPCDIDLSDTTSVVPGTSAVLGLAYVPCGEACVLNYDSNGYYSHQSTGSPSRYTRRITVSTPPPPTGSTVPTELDVTSTVTWTQGSSTQSIVMNESLFDWYGSLGS